MSTEANINTLSEYDFGVLIDASGSMSTEDCPGGKSRWEYMRESLGAFVRDVNKFDSDGIDVTVFSGTNIESHQGVTPDKVDAIFSNRSPRGSTPLAEGLTAALALAGKSPKKDFILVFTDGTPDDPARAADVIRKQAAKQTVDDECSILFIQVGKDAAATAYLRKLDDGLNAKFDIVDAKTIEEAEKFASTAELVLHAISD